MKHQYKIAVYAIAKNEEKFINRWYNSMQEADAIYVLDTGSTDKTYELLKEKGVQVIKKEITPWRFDKARNESLNLVPEDYDICVCSDLDEVFPPGWRDILENAWEPTTKQLSYLYNWNHDEQGKPLISFRYEKIHTRQDFKWIYPVHEVLEYTGTNYHKTYCNNLILDHYQDTNKSRSSYLPLLELSVKENPQNDRNMHYLGREYMYYERYQEAIDTLIKHLELPTSTWKDERCASMRFIARSYANLKRFKEAIMWANEAIKEAPYLKDPYIEAALIYYKINDYQNIIKVCNKSFKASNNNYSYINERFSNDETVYDLLSIAYFYTGNYKKALTNIKKAIKINPNERLKNNLIIIKKALQK